VVEHTGFAVDSSRRDADVLDDEEGARPRGGGEPLGGGVHIGDGVGDLHWRAEVVQHGCTSGTVGA
jgi:hypothetical protein